MSTAPSSNGSETKTGLKIDRVFSDPTVHPFDQITWTKRTAEIKDEKGNYVFKQEDVEFPESWSQLAVNVVASKYFYGDNANGNGSPADGKREWSVKQLVRRVAHTIASWGCEDGYFASTDDAHAFERELTWLLANQYGAFNSPVWFNVGLWDEYKVEGSYDGYYFDYTTGSPEPVPNGRAYEHPAGSACFILGVEDSIPSIYDRVATEGRIFKYGSGCGTNNSSIRSSREVVSGGGKPSGPLSFMTVYDAVAKVTKSGGKVRRAAKMEILDDWHPDILEFIRCKGQEEAKAHALIREGYESNFNGEAYTTVCFQNSNMSVRFSDAFMAKVDGSDPDKSWQTKAVTTGTAYNARGERMPTYDVDKLIGEVAAGTWKCGDPGVQFTDTIQKWHTCKSTGPVNGSNPCCFTYFTYIDTSEGRIPIGELAEMDAVGKELPYAFAFDRTAGMPVLRKIKRAWKAGETTTIARVTTQRGLVFESTPEHRYLMHDGEYVEAALLKPGERLRKVNRQVNTQRSNRKWLLHKVTPERPNGCTPQNRWMWEQVHGPLSDEFEVHYVNEDPTDDRLSNFDVIKERDHQKFHSGGTHNPRYIDVEPQILVDVWERIESAVRKTHKTKHEVTPQRWNKYVAKFGLKGVVPLARSSTDQGRIRGMTWSQFAEWIESQRSVVNDRVESVEIVEVDSPVAVYDIEVDDVHNFGIGSKDSVHSIVVSNSEFIFLDHTACNLACLNLAKFVDADGSYNVDRFRAACRIFFIAQEIIVDRAGYPTAEICQNSHDFRPLGLGYTNLGALLMSQGMPYDSDEGRAYAAAITAVMHGQANLTSTELSEVKGSFNGYAANHKAFREVMALHQDSVYEIADFESSRDIKDAAKDIWSYVFLEGGRHGFRNAQATLLQPCGTTGFMLDSDTTGIEPELALVKYKNLAGRGVLKIVNQTVRSALRKLGYAGESIAVVDGDPDHGNLTDDNAEDMVKWIEEHGSLEGYPLIDPKHLPVFDCAFSVKEGGRSISWKGHIDMMAAVQPFLSGAISKTCNVPEHFSVGDIRDAYVYAWKKGLKCVAIYRENSKASQPLNTKAESKNAKAEPAPAVVAAPQRKRLPETRQAVVHKFEIGGHEGYITVGLYPDESPGEIFVTISKEGSTISGLLDSWATSVSLGLQYGVPLAVLVEKFAHSRYEPSGFSRCPDVPIAKSLTDYISRWLGCRFIPGYREANSPAAKDDWTEASKPVEAKSSAKYQQDSPVCTTCGGLTIRAGTCYTCTACGSSSGCGG